MTESIPDVGMSRPPSLEEAFSVGQEGRFKDTKQPTDVRLVDNEPAYWALLDNQQSLDDGPGVIDRRDAQNAQTLLRRAVEIDKDAVMACAGQTKAAARATLLGILARDQAS